MTKDITRHGGADQRSSLPQPPRGYAPGQEAFGRPPCARCVREGGITVFGRHRPPEPSVIHPNHVSVERDKRGNVEKTIHRGPREPLCAFHVELVGWETVGRDMGYPPPTWTRAPMAPKVVAQVVEKWRSPTKDMTEEECEIEGRLYRDQPMEDQ